MKTELDLLNAITRRVHYFATQMIFLANHRKDIAKGDPKVGGHPTASASSLHLLGALHLVVRSGFDHLAIKPHTSPTDHAFNYLLDLFLDKDRKRMSAKLSEKAMYGLRAFSQKGEPVFQSYHSKYDPDHEGYLPSGTVGIPPVNLGYLALAYDYARSQGFQVPQSAHFWALIGDSEFREGSLFEAMPDFAERNISHLTWIIDYNRQSLDGQRITNTEVMGGNDHHRIAKTALANGWDVIEVQHGSFRKQLFQKEGGQVFQNVLENQLEDLQLQALLLNKDSDRTRQFLLEFEPQLNIFLKNVTDSDLLKGLGDLGGHDYAELIPALEKSKQSDKKPCLLIAHTIKGWGLQSAAQSANHNILSDRKEVDCLRQEQNLSADNLFGRFSMSSKEGQFLKKRGDQLFSQFQERHALKEQNELFFRKQVCEIPDSLGINLKLVNNPHTQWMLGQLTAKLTRIADQPRDTQEKLFQTVGQMMVLMSPDVGTSTNLNPTMDDKIFGHTDILDYELALNVKDRKSPTLIPGAMVKNRFLRFEITEANSMSCMGAFGKMKDILGLPLMPLMTIYDFFIKRALDQYFYNLYWDFTFYVIWHAFRDYAFF